MKNKIPFLVKRTIAFILVLMTLSSVLAISVAAGDSVFLEALINPEKYVYTANFTSDTKARGNKYAYKYMNLAYVYADSCGSKDLNKSESQKNPNYCIRMDGKDVSYSYSKKKNEFSIDSKSKLDMYFLLEGYLTSSGDIITNDDNISSAATAKEKNVMKTKKTKTTSPLSYPGYYTETVTSAQSEYAQETLITLVASLNGILATVNDGKKFTSVADMVNKSIMIRPDSSTNIVVLPSTDGGYTGYVIVYADLQGVNDRSGSGFPSILKERSAGEANRRLSEMGSNTASKGTAYVINPSSGSAYILDGYQLPRASVDNELYCYIFPIISYSESNYTIDAGRASVYPYAIPKGFTAIEASNHTIFSNVLFTKTGGKAYDYTSEQGDVPWISIHMLSMYANLVYKQYGQSVSTYVAPDSNLFSDMIASIFSGLLNIIRSVLGLTNIETLVFNLGSRGSTSYNYGLMSDDWWNVVLQYQLVFQAIAWVILVCGFIKTLIDLNLSTINPQKRSTLYDTIQKFIVVGIGLVIMIPCIQFLLECNDTVVELFASQVETASLNMPIVNNVLAQFIVGMCWITIMLYINFIYIMRSVTVALLIASGPFFISTIAFSKGGRSSLFVSWVKELIANIFVQTIHAFVLSFLVQLLAQGTFIETFAIAISIIPITEMFRQLVFGGAGGSVSSMATAATSTTTKAGTGLVKGITGGIAKSIGSGDGGNNDGSGSGPGGGGGGGGSRQSDTRSIMDQRKSAKIERMAQGTSAGGKIRQRSEAKTGKAGGTMRAKIGGAILDAAGIAGMDAVSGFEAMADFQDALSDVQLSGNASGVGRAVEKHTSGAIQSGASMGRSVAGAIKHKQNRQKTSSKDLSVKAESQSHMGQTALSKESKGRGQNDNGGVIQTDDKDKARTIYAPITDKSPETMDISDQGNQSVAAAIGHFQAGTNQRAEGALARTANGEYRKGTNYSYTTSDGKQSSFFVSDKARDAALPYSGVEPAAPSGGSNVRIGQGQNISSTGKVRAALAKTNGDVDNKFNGYTDENGNSVGNVRKYQGSLYADDGLSASNAHDILSKHIDDQMNRSSGAVFSQNRNEFTEKFEKKYRTDKEGVYDLSSPSSSAEYTDAAMISKVGAQVGNGVYTIGDKQFRTGMTPQFADKVLNSRGINGIENKDGTISYHQHTPPNKNSSFVEARTVGNRTIAKYNAGIGTPDGPSWKSDGAGGGQMTFANKRAAMNYFQGNGAAQMADRIASGAQSTSLHDFREDANGFTVEFRGKDLARNGMRMEQHGDGKSLMVSSGDARVSDPFAIDSGIVGSELANQPDVDIIADSNNSSQPNVDTPQNN